MLHRHAAIQTAGAVDLQPIGKKVDLHRRSLCVNAVISVNDRVQNGLADGIDRIFRPILPCAGDRVNDRANLHIPAAECNGILHHRVNGALDALVVCKAGRIGIRITDLCSRNNDRGNAQLREIALRIEAEIHNGSQGHFPIAGDIQHFQRLFSGKLRKARTIRPALEDILLQLVPIQHGERGPLHRTLIIVQMAAERLVAV